MENLENESQQLVTRRDALRRGAILGGTLVWAAPIIQSQTRPAFAATPEQGYSVFWVLLLGKSGDNVDKVFRAKYDGEGWDDGWDDGHATGSVSRCGVFSSSYGNALRLTDAAGVTSIAGKLGFPVENADAETVTLTLPNLTQDDFEIVGGAITDGQGCNSSDGDGDGVISLNPGLITIAIP